MSQVARLIEQRPAFSADGALREAMEAFLLSFGFTALRLTITRLENEIAKEHRELLALQGWIA